MKLIIDIPEEVKQAFDCAESNDLKGGYYDHGGIIGNAIKNGTPLDDVKTEIADIPSIPSAFEGMTNGEVIQALFPNISVYEHGSTYSVNNEYNFNSTWWNAPYQKGGEE